MKLKCNEVTLGELVDWYKTKKINLEPPYQRKPIWSKNQRIRLLTSIFNGIPIPSLIFNVKYTNRSKLVYDVLDGKQRIETILDFVERKVVEEDILYAISTDPQTNKKSYIYFDELKKKKLDEKFWKYPLSYIEYEDVTDFNDVPVSDFEIFVKINSTGSKLLPGEIRWAKNHMPFSKLAFGLINRPTTNLFQNSWRVFNAQQIKRYQLYDYILELCTAIMEGDYLDRKKKVDEYLEKVNVNLKELNNTKRTFRRILKWILAIFPKHSLKITRFKNKSEFYSLFIVLYKLAKKGYVTINKRSNKLAQQFLNDFSLQLNEITVKKDVSKLDPTERNLLNYLSATRQATDSKKNRQIRDEYLTNILKGGIFVQKDHKRNFTRNDRDILWLKLYKKHDGRKIRCPNPRHNKSCKKYLTYENAQVDHRWAWSQGGPTKLKNAKLLCFSCNAAKSNK